MRHVYMLAFACEPGRGSEPGVGFAFTLGLARHSKQTGRKVTVLTRSHRIAEIREALALAGLESFVELVPVKVPLWFVRLTYKNRRWIYILWQAKAIWRLRALIRKSNGEAIIHHVTFATDSLPTFEFWLPRSVARVFGPAGSSQKINDGLSSGITASARKWLRNTIRSINLRGAKVLIAQNSHVASEWARYSGTVLTEPNIVVSSGARDLALSTSARRDGQIVSVGLLIERKRHSLAIDAFAALSDKSTHLTIVGNGPLEDELRTQVNRAGLGERVSFAGKLSRAETLAQIAGASVLILASRQEGAGWVVGEAQTLGTTPVVIAGSGSDTIVQLGGGVIAADSSVESLTDGLQRALAAPFQATDRWSENRLGPFLASCYVLCD